MSRDVEVELGSLTRTIRDGARWESEACFPGTQVWADEIERILSFLQSQGVLSEFIPRFRGDTRQRDAAFAEARVGFFFHRNHFKILTWSPKETNCPGDLEIQWRDTSPIFIEVKGPTWQAELTPEERLAGRKSQPRIVDGQVRSVNPSVEIRGAVLKALPKLSSTRANLVAIVDDLFLSPLDHPSAIFTGEIDAYLATAECGRVSGVFLFKAVSWAGFVEYRKHFIPNRSAVRPLPGSVLQGLLRGNSDPVGPWWART